MIDLDKAKFLGRTVNIELIIEDRKMVTVLGTDCVNVKGKLLDLGEKTFIISLGNATERREIEYYRVRNYSFVD
jgi:hypothetical protein